MPRRRARGSDFNLSADINVTSLVDVAFTLLVIFIITAPILQGGVEVKVPKAQSESISTPDGVIVTLTREGRLYIGDAPATWGEFPAALTDVVRERQTHSLYLKADETVPYGQVLRVLGEMKSLDIGSVGLVAEPEPASAGGGG
ncbi:MAG TPA: biopolymer transporter ExbD [Longimicrobiaceae bacterium]|nr:biopolymer transporter ExbD [Longimicrobiaceae bacterium]